MSITAKRILATVCLPKKRELIHVRLRPSPAAEPDRALRLKVAHHDPVGVPLANRDFVNPDHARRRWPRPAQLFAHVDLVEFIDGMAIEMHPPRHVLGRHRVAKPADLHRKPQGVLRVRRQKGLRFVPHPGGFAVHPCHPKIEIEVPIPASEIACPPPTRVVNAAARIAAAAAHRFFERRSSVITKTGLSRS